MKAGLLVPCATVIDERGSILGGGPDGAYGVLAKRLAVDEEIDGAARLSEQVEGGRVTGEEEHEVCVLN